MSPVAQIEMSLSTDFELDGSWWPMTVILMSRTEIDRMNVLRDLAEERIRISEAATLMGLSRRQVFRLAQGISAARPCGAGVAPAREAKQPLLPGGAADRTGRDHREPMRTSGRRLLARSLPSCMAFSLRVRRSGDG